jgi:putative RNA ligase
VGLSHSLDALDVRVHSWEGFTITEHEEVLNMSSYQAPHLYDIVDSDEIGWLLVNGYVREQEHPTEFLAILNYTDKAQVAPKVFADYPSLNQCRGLIYNTENGEVVARPFPKFWNYGQTGAAEIPLDVSVIVTDKVDGSLGILYREPGSGRLSIATRGSFASDQALHATQVLRERYPSYRPPVGQTMLFEIVYPENRIVLDYAGQDDLVLLGSVETRRGYVCSPNMAASSSFWRGPMARQLPHQTLAQALAAPPRANAEGFVVRYPTLDGDKMVKIKQEDYVALHRIVTGLNERTVWEHLKAGKPLQSLLEPLPDEFHPWVRTVALRLQRQVASLSNEIDERYLGYVQQMTLHLLDHQEVDKREAAKIFAGYVKDDPQAWAMFAIRQAKDIEPKLWELAKPEAGKNPSNTPLEV